MKEKKSIKKLIAFFGTVLAIMALMCTAAFAGNSETDEAAIGDKRYATFNEAFQAAKDGDTITLLKDAVLSDSSNLDTGYTYTVNGQKHKLKITTGRWIIANITFENINIDISALNGGTAFSIASGSVTLGSDAVVDGKVDAKNNGGGRFCYVQNDSGSFNMKDRSEIKNISYTASAPVYGGAVQLDGGVFNMTGGTISGCKADAGGAVCIKGGKMVMSGGTISNNSSNWPQGGGIYIEKGTLNVSGNAYIYDNWASNGANDIYGAAENIVVNGEFSGKIGIRVDSFAADAQVATAAEGASLATTGTVICDNGGRDYFAYIKDKKLLLTYALTLESKPADTGKYVKDGEKLGVARVITTVSDVKNPASVEYMGTFFCLNEKDKENKDKIDTNASYKLTDLSSKLEAGKGYMADVYGISADTATIYAVNYYKFYGINGVVFSEPITINYSKSTAKTVEYTE